MKAFNYLGRVMTEGYYDLPEVTRNIQKARKSWGWMSRILSPEGAGPKVLGQFSKTVVQAVLMFGAEKWFLTPRAEQALSSFQHRVARRLTRRHTRSQGGGS